MGVNERGAGAIGDLPRGHGILGLLIRDPRPRRMRDISQHPDSFGFPPNHPPMHSFLGAPVRIRDEVFGNLYMAEKQGAEEFTAEDEAMLVALAAAAGVAIDNARLYDRSQRQRRWSEAVGELTQTLLEAHGRGRCPGPHGGPGRPADRRRDDDRGAVRRVGPAGRACGLLHRDAEHAEPPPEVSVGTALEGALWESVVTPGSRCCWCRRRGSRVTHALALDVRRLGGMSPHGADRAAAAGPRQRQRRGARAGVDGRPGAGRRRTSWRR